MKRKKTKAQCASIAYELRKLMYDVLKEEGVCVRCGSAPTEDHGVFCSDCKLYWREKK